MARQAAARVVMSATGQGSITMPQTEEDVYIVSSILDKRINAKVFMHLNLVDLKAHDVLHGAPSAGKARIFGSMGRFR